MKTSRRLLLGTFVTLLVAPVVLVAYSRISGDGYLSELPPPERTSSAELAALRDFTSINVRGDFNLEVVSAPDYAVDYTPLPQGRGFFRASVADGTLTIEGYGNRTEFGTATVRVALPELSEMDAESLPALTVQNFDSESLTLRAFNVGDVSITNNRIGALQMQTQVRSIAFRGNTIGSSDVRTVGTQITSD